MSYARLLDLVSIGLIFICWAICPTDFSALISQSLANEFVKLYLDLPYSRQLESEADKIGLMIAARGCYDVRKSVNFWKNMNKSEDGKEKSEIPEYMSTHPSNEHRSQDLEKLMPDALKLREECKCYELDKKIGFFQAITEVLKAAKTEQTTEKAK
jgi:predicted Zn-dependent protease